ncbi:hypothetical protein [Qipengyuania sp.]|uniref:hypothetical protein n=2 Tax=Qipengyuania sp. TaxID=2004515 RepID=UPI003C7A57AD
MRKSVLFLLPLLGACTTVPASGPSAPPVSRPGASPPPQEVRVAPSTQGFRAPRVMNVPGLEGVIGRNETALANLFGPPRLSVTEGDAKKLQFTGEACVLDVYLYPLEPRGEPSATYVDARRASDGLDVDRAACVAALER